MVNTSVFLHVPQLELCEQQNGSNWKGKYPITVFNKIQGFAFGRHFCHSSQRYTRATPFHAVEIIIITHQTARCHINKSWIISIENRSEKSLDDFPRRLRRDPTIQDPYPSKIEQLKGAYNANTDHLSAKRTIFFDRWNNTQSVRRKYYIEYSLFHDLLRNVIC